MPTTDEIQTPSAAPPPVDEPARPLSEIDTPTPVPLPAPVEAYERFEAIFADTPPPFAFLDLDAVWSNAADMLRRAHGKPIRIATGAIRSLPVLRRLLDLDPGFQGALTFSLAEALWLWERGVRDLVVAHSSTDRACLVRLARVTSEDPDQAPVLMVDSTEHLDLIEDAASSFVAPIRVAIDIDLSWRGLGGLVRFGVPRSPVRTPEDAVALVREIERRGRVKLVGARAYEQQIAETGDNVPGKGFTNLRTRALRSASSRELTERRDEIVSALTEVAELDFVNGGGTGSLEASSEQWSVTELAAGSGFYAPVRLDHFRAFRLRPAALFTLALSRGTGAASLAMPGAQRALPPAGTRLDMGRRAYFRDLEAGTLCERFNRLILVTGSTIRDEVPTYRGDGRSFI
jgi:D-serine deaminase-like pyridoxal phosphate-dependent protein